MLPPMLDLGDLRTLYVGVRLCRGAHSAPARYRQIAMDDGSMRSDSLREQGAIQGAEDIGNG